MNEKVLVLNGGSAAEPLCELERHLMEASSSCGCNARVMRLWEMSIAPCLGCFGCWTKTPGMCVIDDDARDVTQEMIRSGVVVFLTPVVFGGYSPELKGALDRSIVLISPLFERIHGEIHHKKRYAEYPRLLGIGVQQGINKEEAAIFDTLVHRNAINFHSPKTVVQIIDQRSDPALINSTVERAFREVSAE